MGGENNNITQGDIHSFIGGGIGNVVTGPCSAIIGGANNNDGGLANVHIAGSGINGVNSGALHVNDLWASGLLYNPLVAPAIFVMPTGAVPPFTLSANGGQLWIM